MQNDSGTGFYNTDLGGRSNYQELVWYLGLPCRVMINYYFSRYCGSPADYDIPRNYEESNLEAFSFNLNRFDSLPYAVFVVFTFLNVTGWSGTTFFYWHSLSTYFTAFYFMTLIFLL